MRISLNIPRSVFNDKMYELMFADTRYRVVWGGAGSGKSYGLTQGYVYKLLTEKHNLLVIRQVADSNRDSTFALFKQILNSWKLIENKVARVNESIMKISFINGNEVIFKGLDNSEKLKSITFSNGELSDVWIEEASEILQDDFNQLDVRLRGGNSKKQITLSFNPIDINHWIKKKFIDDKETRELTTLCHSTYLDNKFIDDDYKRLLESYKETDRYWYEVYALGQWGVLGQSLYDARKVQERIRQCDKPLYKFYFDYDKDMKFTKVVSQDGYISVYEEPIPGHKYVIGGDTASGVGSDFSVCQVFDNDTGHQVAVLHERMDSDLYAKQAYCLGHYYNYALIGIEVNFDLYPIKWLEEHDYTNQYVREQQDTFTGGIKKAFGFRTDSFTRPRIISQSVEIVREYTHLFQDIPTLEEMLTFVRNDKGRPEAQEGAHDDLILAMCIALDIRKQVRYELPEKDEEEHDDDYVFVYGE